MKKGSLCFIKNKKNALNPYVVVYSDIDEVLKQRNKNNSWLPCMTTSANIKKFLPTKQRVLLKSLEETFLLIEELKDDNGSFYYHCLYNDSCGWIIWSKKNFTIEEKSDDKH